MTNLLEVIVIIEMVSKRMKKIIFEIRRKLWKNNWKIQQYLLLEITQLLEQLESFFSKNLRDECNPHFVALIIQQAKLRNYSQINNCAKFALKQWNRLPASIYRSSILISKDVA